MVKVKEISKNELRSIYSFDKIQKFWESARGFMKDLDMDCLHADNFGKKLDAQEQAIGDLKINKIKDFRNSLTTDDGEKIDFIFADKKVFLISCYKKDKQQKFAKLINKHFE